MVDDLHRLLNYASDQPKPLLLIGVDYSTFIARFYTQLYEQLVKHVASSSPTIIMYVHIRFAAGFP